MKVIDEGHSFELAYLDSPLRTSSLLIFVKREGERYPGNIGHHPGTTMQECLRACIKRAIYVNNQIPCSETRRGIYHMRITIKEFEQRAAQLHGREFYHYVPLSGYSPSEVPIEDLPTCIQCGHIGCNGECRHAKKPTTS